MIRNILKRISSKIYFQQIITESSRNILNVKYLLGKNENFCTNDVQKSSTIISKKKPDKIKTISNPNSQQNAFDAEDYILSYPVEYEKLSSIISRTTISKLLSEKFQMTEEEIKQIPVDDMKLKRHNTVKDFTKNLDLLIKYDISSNSIIANPWILIMNSKILQNKLESLNCVKYRDINDIIKFLKITAPRLQKLMLFLKKDAQLIPTAENRFYYISDRLKLDPKIVSSYLTKRLFMLQMPFYTLQVNLNYMLQYGVNPLSILKDLWAFRYTPQLIKSRLERAKMAKKDKIMPWMVRCPERILEKSLKLALDENELLGDNQSVIDYVSSRLGYDVQSTKAIMTRHPAVLRVRVTKIKEVLDYLLDEAKVEQHEIAQVPRILCHSLDTTRKRLEELKSYGCKPSSLIILCRSRREYGKFLNNWIGTSKYKKDQIKIADEK